MEIFHKFIILALIAGAIAIQEIESSVLNNTWWGPGKPGKDNNEIVPFNITVPDEVILDLNQRLEIARPLTPSLEGVAQDYGINSNLLQKIVDFWKTKYDWKQREKILNKYPQFKTQIQGLQIHYIHVKPTNPKNLKVLPLLLLHGWPGSVREFYEIIPMLTTPQPNQKFVFEVIVPSLPGFGFSQAAAKPGLGAIQMAVVFKNLMQRLGFEKYYLQGGDWGSIIASSIATLFEDHVLGIHLNMCVLDSHYLEMKYCLDENSKSVMEKEFMYEVFGYFHMQATRPDTLGVGLNDSPAGLAAYILDLFSRGTNINWQKRVDGGLKLKFKYEDLLDNVMIYWVTNSITTSVRLYAETMKQIHIDTKATVVKVPTACAKMEHDIFHETDSALREKYPNLIQSNEYRDVGHFAAFEAPKVLSQDIWSAVEKFRKIKETLGCDGVKSSVRNAMGVQYTSWDYDQVGVVATLHLADTPDNFVAWQRFLPTGPIALLPLSDNLSSLVWSTTSEHAKKLLSLSDSEFAAAVNEAYCKEYPKYPIVQDTANFFDQFLRSLNCPSTSARQLPPKVLSIEESSRAYFPLGFGHATNYVVKNAALVGDAAHRVHPLAGQGVNLGYGDVACLNDVLGKAVYSGSKLNAMNYLKDYESQRQLHNVPTMMAIEGLHRLYQTDFTPIVLLRSVGLQFTHALSPLKKLIMSQSA